ncbi:MAG: rhodanese-like domain-containing protein [Fluviicola sp.]|nr:rhodanese-like domain-containing protein [Fluviicola sp.]
MKGIIGILTGMLLISSCSEAQVKTNNIAKKETVASDIAQVNKVVSAKEFKELLKKDNIQVIDVRTAGEVADGKIENAVNIDYFGDDFKTKIAALDKSKVTLVYCKSGGRSGKAAKMMKDLGFVEVYDLKGGYSGWPFK